jgi:hypothetical protein
MKRLTLVFAVLFLVLVPKIESTSGGLVIPVRLAGSLPKLPGLEEIGAFDQMTHIIDSVEVMVGRDGLVEGVKFLEPHSSMFLDHKDAVQEEIKKWRFSPAKLNGREIPVIITTVIVYKWEKSK